MSFVMRKNTVKRYGNYLAMAAMRPFQGVGVRTKIWTSTDSERSWNTMYFQDKINIALQVYHPCGSVTNTIRMLGYPTRRALYTWIENGGGPKDAAKGIG